MLLLRVIKTRDVLRSVTVIGVAGGLSLIACPGTAFADSRGPGPIGLSPAREVVQFAPNAVSVTFSTPLRSSGASMRITTKAGQVGAGPVSTDARTLRRSIETGSPNGPYTVDWTAVAQDGTELSGTFRFTAARPALDPQASSAPDTQRLPGGPTPTTAVDPDPAAAPVASDPAATDPAGSDPAGPGPGPATSDAGGAPSSAVVVTGTDPGERSWIAAAPRQSDATDATNSAPGVDPAAGSTLLAIGLAAALVGAAGLVSRRHRSGGSRTVLIRTSRGVYPV